MVIAEKKFSSAPNINFATMLHKMLLRACETISAFRFVVWHMLILYLHIVILFIEKFIIFVSYIYVYMKFQSNTILNACCHKNFLVIPDM